jgi:hypothetical protein
MSATRVKLNADADTTRAVWISVKPERKVFLWENLNWPDFFGYELSEYHSTADRFTYAVFRELDDIGCSQLLINDDDFRTNPVEALCELGAEATPTQYVTMLYRLIHVCTTVTDESGLVASFGCPIAVWLTDSEARHRNESATNLSSVPGGEG